MATVLMRYISAFPSATWNTTPRHSLVILGSTGSIGRSALDVVAACPQRFDIVALAGGRNVALLAEQIQRWHPQMVAVQDAQAAESLHKLLPDPLPILCGQEGYEQLARLEVADTVLSALVGAAGLRSTLAAVSAGKLVCLANKESLVLGGPLIRKLCAQHNAVILPVDSEHNAVFQAMLGHAPEHIQRIILTASGGPFRGWSVERLAKVRADQALKHPNWSMGAKITIDSASLMNKGLEVIEAHALYDLPSEQISVIVHPQSVVHSLIELRDGSSLAQLGTPDMRIPISQCLNWPHCPDVGVPVLDLAAAGSLTFEQPDLLSFPCLELARRAMREGSAATIALNAANEEAVAAFLDSRIGFMDIPRLIEQAMDHCLASQPDDVDSILACDAAAREYVCTVLGKKYK